MLTFTHLGTSSGVPTRQRNVSGIAVQTCAGAGWFLIDAGEGTQHRLQQTRLLLHTLDAICITHVHGDHCYGLPGLLASAGMAGRTRALTLVAPLPVWDWLQATRQCTDLYLPYELVHVNVADVLAQPWVWDAPDLRIEAHPLRHRVPSYAYSVQVERQQSKLDVAALQRIGLPPGPLWKALQEGRDVEFAGQLLCSHDMASHITQRVRAVFGGDNAEPALLHAACQGAQVLVHEATYTQAVLDQVGPGPMHSSAQQVAAFAQHVGLPNLVLTHFSARYHNPQGLEELQNEARAQYQGALWLAQDLDQFHLAADGSLQQQTISAPTGLLAP